jgi:hypothetical protein
MEEGAEQRGRSSDAGGRSYASRDQRERLGEKDEAGEQFAGHEETNLDSGQNDKVRPLVFLSTWVDTRRAKKAGDRTASSPG